MQLHLTDSVAETMRSNIVIAVEEYDIFATSRLQPYVAASLRTLRFTVAPDNAYATVPLLITAQNIKRFLRRTVINGQQLPVLIVIGEYAVYHLCH